MAATKGRALRVKAATTSSGGSFAVIAGIESASYERDGTNIDVTTLTDADMLRIQVMKDTKISLSGNYEGGDTAGQVAIFSAYENDTTIFLQFLPDGSTGWQKEFKVAKISISASTKDKQSVSIDLEGTGATTGV